MAQFVIVSVIPYMYKCHTCKEPIMEREALGIRTDTNYYFHNKKECRFTPGVEENDTRTDAKEV